MLGARGVVSGLLEDSLYVQVSTRSTNAYSSASNKRSVLEPVATAAARPTLPSIKNVAGGIGTRWLVKSAKSNPQRTPLMIETREKLQLLWIFLYLNFIFCDVFT